MSFGPSSQTQSGFNTLQQNNAATSAAAPPLVNAAGSNLGAGANFFKTLLGGNQAETAAMLQPDINRINQGNQQTLQAVSTLTPRGGGRSASLFALPFQGQQQIQSLFNGARAGAAQALPQIGSAQGALGSNLFDISNKGAGTLGELGQRQQQITQSARAALLKGILGAVSGIAHGGGLANLFKPSGGYTDSAGLSDTIGA